MGVRDSRKGMQGSLTAPTTFEISPGLKASLIGLETPPSDLYSVAQDAFVE